MNAFNFNKNGELRPNESGRAGGMAKTRQVANIFYVILYTYLSATQQVLARFKAVFHNIIIGHVKIVGLIVQR